MSSATATSNKPKLPKIIVRSFSGRGLRRIEALLLVVEDPMGPVVLHAIHAQARYSRQLVSPSDGVPEAGIERTEVAGCIYDGFSGEIVLDTGLLEEVIDHPSGVVIVQSDELTDLDARGVLLHVDQVLLGLRRVQHLRIRERRSG